MTTMTIIDACGPDHGLKVELQDRTLTVIEWAADCDADEHGNYNPRLLTASRGLGLALAEYAQAEPGMAHTSQSDRVIRAATHMLCLCGSDDVEWLDEDTRPDEYFCERVGPE